PSTASIALQRAQLNQRRRLAKPIMPKLRPASWQNTRRQSTYHDTATGQVGLGFRHAVFAKVEDAGGQHRVGLAFEDPGSQVLQVADAAGGDHRDAHALADGAGHAEV